MQRFAFQVTRMRAALILMLVGGVFILAAFVRVANVPIAAHHDFGALVRSLGGSISHSANYPDTYRMMAAQSRLLQNAYLGFTGVALVTVGAAGVISAAGRGGQAP